MIICIKVIIRAEEEDVGVALQEEGVEDVVVTEIVASRQVITVTPTETAHMPAEIATHREITIRTMLPSPT